MEYVKKCLRFCCKKCCDKSRKDSTASVRVILPVHRRNKSDAGIQRSHPGTPTMACFAQPEFQIPLGDGYLPVPHSFKRKQSAPEILTSSVQPRSRYASTNSLLDLQERIDEEDDFNNNEERYFGMRRADSVPNVNDSPSSAKPKPMHRLSVTSHSRRNSMSSFEISTEELDSELYGSGDWSTEANSNGRICFSLSYNASEETVTIFVICANLRTNHDIETIDSYVKVSIIPHKKKFTKYTTNVHKNNANPEFNQLFTFQSVTGEDLMNHAVKLTAYYSDKHSRAHRIGSVTQSLEELLIDEYKQNIWKNICRDSKKETDQGSLLVSTSYYPTSGELFVGISKAKNLAYPDSDKAIEGVFAKIVVLANGKILKKEKTRASPMSAHPDYGETFTIDLPSSLLHQACVVVVMVAKNTFGKRSYIGYVSIGPPFFANGTGLEQWTKMLSLPYTTVHKWHSLSTVNRKDKLLNDCQMF